MFKRRSLGFAAIGLAGIIVVVLLGWRVSLQPYPAGASGTERFSVPVRYIRALAVFRKPETEERLVELSGNGRVLESSIEPTGVAIQLPIGPGDESDGNPGFLGRLAEAATRTQLGLHGELIIDPANPYMQGYTVPIVKDVSADLDRLSIHSYLAESRGILRAHDKKINIQRGGDHVDVTVELRIEVEYDVPPLDVFQSMVRRGVQSSLDDELRRTRGAIETLLTEGP